MADQDLLVLLDDPIGPDLLPLEVSHDRVEGGGRVG